MSDQLSSLALKSEAERWLLKAFAAQSAYHELDVASVRQAPGLTHQQSEQRTAILQIGQKVCNGQFEDHMDKLVSTWLAYRRSQQP